MVASHRQEPMHTEGATDARVWAPLADAATAYGVSVDTLRRRMRRGELEARREAVPQGFRWLVPLPDAATPGQSATPRSSGGEVSTVSDRGTTALVATVEALQQELAIRAQEIERLHDIIATQARTIEHAAASSIGAPVATSPLAQSVSAPLAPEPAPSPAQSEPSPQEGLGGLWRRLRELLRA